MANGVIGLLSNSHKLMSTIKAASKVYDSGFLTVFLRVLYMRLKKQFTLDEICLLDLANPRQPLNKAKTMVSRRLLFDLQKEDNHPGYNILTEDKAIFYVYCSGMGIPVPTFYGVYNQDGGRTADGSALTTNADWSNFFCKTVSENFVVKPTRGVYGRGVSIFKRNPDNTSFQDCSGGAYTLEELREKIVHDSRYSDYIVQERVMNHPEITMISGSDVLQTVRVVTYVDKKTLRPSILFAVFKIANGDSLVSDNFDSGQSGNLCGDVNTENGEILSVYGRSESGFGLDKYRCHPNTSFVFQGWRLPSWKDVAAFAKDLALKFMPLHSVGWDIAVTENGPVLIEGNMWWDPHNEGNEMGGYLKARSNSNQQKP